VTFDSRASFFVHAQSIHFILWNAPLPLVSSSCNIACFHLAAFQKKHFEKPSQPAIQIPYRGLSQGGSIFNMQVSSGSKRPLALLAALNAMRLGGINI